MEASRTLLTLLVAGALSLGGFQAPAVAAQAREDAPDARALARAARTASYRYESLQRRTAPTTNQGGRRGDQCDERIGRFCFWYDSPSDPPAPPLPPEPPAVADARVVAVRAHRLWFAADPASSDAAGFLVRYLVEDDRTAEAVAAARAHVWAARAAPEALFVLGLALHYHGDFLAAEAAFDSARAVMPDEDRRRVDDVRVLLEGPERGRYGRLGEAERDRYHERFWALSDPSLLQPGNERRSGHYARHAWARIHEKAPRVQGKTFWASDYEEIVIRFGLPVSRRRIRDFHPYLSMTEPSYIESFDHRSVALVPPALLTRGLPEAPPPGMRHELARDTAPSSYPPVRLRLAPMDVVPTRIPEGGGALLRIDAVLAPDTLEPRVPVSPRGLLVILDTMGRELLREPAWLERAADSAIVMTATAPVPAGEWIYRVELLDDSTGLAGLSQYRVVIPGPATAGAEPALSLSDLMVAEPFGDPQPVSHDDPALLPHPTSLLPVGSRVGLFASVTGLRRGRSYTVEWAFHEVSEGTLLGDAARWLGRRLGLVRAEAPLRLRWEDVAGGERRVPIAVNMDLAEAGPGLYRISLRVTDALTGESLVAERLVRLTAGPPGPPPG